MRKPIVYILLVCLMSISCSPRTASTFPAGRWVDLTHDFSEETLYWVTAEPFKRITVAEGVTPAGFYYSAYNYSAAEHGGTTSIRLSILLQARRPSTKSNSIS